VVLALEPALPHPGEHGAVVERSRRRAEHPGLDVRPRRDGRLDRFPRRVAEDLTLVEDQAVDREAADRALRPGREVQLAAVAELDVLTTQRRHRLAADLLAEVVVVLEVGQDPLEADPRRLLLVRRVDDRLLAEQQQAGQLARLDQRALAVLPRDADADRGSCPLPIGADAHRRL
jgi:hypothetical protein